MSSLYPNFVKFLATIPNYPQSVRYPSCPSGTQALNLPPFCLDPATSCGPGTPCISNPNDPPPGLCDDGSHKTCTKRYCAIKATQDLGNLKTTWTVNPTTGECSTVANAQNTWCLQQLEADSSSTCATAGSDPTCVGFWTSLSDCEAAGFLPPGSGPNPPHPHPHANCVSCGQNAQCCPVDPSTTGSMASQADCCKDCTYSFVCNSDGTTKLVKGSPTNSWAKSEDATCWSCDGSQCNPVAFPSKGKWKTSECGGTCVTYYQCDPAGSGNVVKTTANTGLIDPSKVKCWTCVDGTATAVAATSSDPAAQGQFLKGKALCYQCSTDGAGSCEKVPDHSAEGTNSTNKCTEAPCTATKFVCDSQGNPVPNANGVDKGLLKCWHCDGNGPAPMPAGTTTQGTCKSMGSCSCYSCSSTGFCNPVASGETGNYTDPNCGSSCKPRLFSCDPQGNATPNPNGIPQSSLNCFQCNGAGQCVVVPNGKGTTNSKNCGLGCWECFPNATNASPVPTIPDHKRVDPLLKPCLLDGPSQCCGDLSNCKGSLCVNKGECCTQGKPNDKACSKGQTCTSDCKCVSKLTFPAWAIGVIIGVVVIAIIGGIVGGITAAKRKRAALEQQAQEVATPTYNPDAQQ